MCVVLDLLTSNSHAVVALPPARTRPTRLQLQETLSYSYPGQLPSQGALA